MRSEGELCFRPILHNEPLFFLQFLQFLLKSVETFRRPLPVELLLVPEKLDGDQRDHQPEEHDAGDLEDGAQDPTDGRDRIIISVPYTGDCRDCPPEAVFDGRKGRRGRHPLFQWRDHDADRQCQADESENSGLESADFKGMTGHKIVIRDKGKGISKDR